MTNIIKKNVLAVIVTFNRIDLLKECIYALSKSSILCDILIVNNNSSDGTYDYLNNIHNEYKNITFYIHNLNQNLNGAGGFNFGLREACKLEYKYIWLMDDDCIVSEFSLEKLLDSAIYLNDKFGFLSSKVLWKDGSICKTNVQRKSVARKIKDFNTKLVNVDYTSFVSCFVKTSDVKNIGLPIKEFIIWTDDLEWTRRLTCNKFYKLANPGYLCNDSIVIHKCANNFGVTIVKDSPDRLSRYKYIYRNDVVCFRREGIRGHLYMLVRNLYHIFRILLFAPYKKINRIKVLLNGYFEGYKFFPNIEYV